MVEMRRTSEPLKTDSIVSSIVATSEFEVYEMPTGYRGTPEYSRVFQKLEKAAE